MFLSTTIAHPGGGKSPDARAVLEAFVRDRQAQGTRISLSQSVGGQDGTALFVNRLWASLAEALDTLSGPPVDPSLAGKMAPLVRPPVSATLWELVVERAAAAPQAPFAVRQTFTPAMGKGPAVRDALEARAKARQSNGADLVLSTSVTGPTALVLVTFYASAAALEAGRAALLADPAQRAAVETVGPMLASQVVSDITRSIVPMPAA